MRRINILYAEEDINIWVPHFFFNVLQPTYLELFKG